MARQINLSKLSEKELVQLRNEVDKALADLAARNKQDALKAAQKEAKKHGFSLDELIGQKKKARKPKTPSLPKYRHPENHEVTWTGRGRQPGWIKDALARGQSLEDFAI